MCYKLEELQRIIDNSYDGDIDEALAHIKKCPKCRENFQRLKQQDKFMESIMQFDMKIPEPRSTNIYKVDFNKDNKRRIFNMSKVAKKWSAVAAGLVLCGGLLFNDPIRAKASDLLKSFRVNKVVGISLTQSDISEISQMFSKGNGTKDIEDMFKMDVKTDEKRKEIQNPKNEDEIKNALGLKENSIKIPEGFVCGHASKEGKTNVSLTFNVDKMNDVLAYLGEEARLPKSLHNKAFTMDLSEAESYSLTKKDDGNKGIYINKVKAPEIQIPKDVDEKELIKVMFSMKILPEDLKKQFAAIDDLTSIVPIMYNEEHQTKEEININGKSGVVIKDKNSNYMNICFKDNENLYTIDSSDFTLDEILNVIKEMK